MLYTEILNDNKDFLVLYRKGKTGKVRIGITAGKKIGNAVHRNRAKRIIRQAYRENECLMPLGIDIVIVARSAVCSAKSQELSCYLRKYGIPEINRLLFGTP